MEEEHQGIQFHQALVAHGMIEDAPEEAQGAVPDIKPDEYMDTNYEFEGNDEDMEEVRDTDEAPVESPTDKADQDHPAPPGNPMGEDRSPEAEAVALRQQLFAREARAVQAKLERNEVIREMTEMAQMLAQHFKI